jgi:hypothetical protein
MLSGMKDHMANKLVGVCVKNGDTKDNALGDPGIRPCGEGIVL